ncbi:hypothetical protein [Nakamurella lactea]|uniref:hypothetical protein n=1 Tax=Nakamurella lactea TaxID=459515 RepID=UPI00040174F3|nr:hypothetical protein [Nakamurella lactea]
MRGKPAVLVLTAVLTAALLTACAASAVPGSAGTPGSTAGSTTANGGVDVRFDSSPDAVVLSVVHTRATIAGVQSSSTTTVYGDGRVVRPADDGIRDEQLRIAPDSLQELLNQVAKLRGAADPGTPVTDVGYTDVTFTVDGQSTEIHSGDVPSGSMSGPDDSPAGRARAAVTAVVERLDTLQGLTVVEQPALLPPRRFTIRIDPQVAGDDLDGALDWPFDRPPATVFADGRCLVLSGGEAVTMVEVLVTNGAEGRDGTTSVLLRTGDPVLPALQIRKAVGCPVGDPPIEARPIPQPWPATDRRWSTGYEAMAIEQVLFAAANRSDPKLLGHDLSDLQWWKSTGTADGRQIYDVEGVPRDRAAVGVTVALRIDAGTGKILAAKGGR